jgi:hypothetical protein
MMTIAYRSPLVPPEWIAAHGVRPAWLRLRRVEGRQEWTSRARTEGWSCHPAAVLHRGVCPFAGSVVQAVLSETQAGGVVLTTTCDQIRHAAALAGRVSSQCGGLPIFLMNVPATWQTPAARQLYLGELGRLGRFLVRLGGQSPSADELTRVMLEFDRARRQVCAARPRLSGRGFAEAVAELRGDGRRMAVGSGLGAGGQGTGGRATGARDPKPVHASSITNNPAPAPSPPPVAGGSSSPVPRPRPLSPRKGVPLALVGGPLLEEDFDLFDMIEQVGGRMVLDATEGGERTLPPPFDVERTRHDPLGELADAYLRRIPEVFRRPNDLLYEWLRRELAARVVRGVLFRRYLWCDVWHAELYRLKQLTPLPVLDLDVVSEDPSPRSHTLSRLEAFLEMLA